ncbi:MAG: lytic transglycosylase domain-containing protein [Bryobacterales bacterium]|nr:lytic transglycosylase domain-containing protein [Bryobacterales bacterium]
MGWRNEARKPGLGVHQCPPCLASNQAGLHPEAASTATAVRERFKDKSTSLWHSSSTLFELKFISYSADLKYMSRSPVAGVLCMLSWIMHGQQLDPYEAIRRAQEASIEQQKKSVRTQTANAVEAGNFFPAPFRPLRASGEGTASDAQPGAVAASCDPMSQEDLEETIEAAAAREGLTPDLLRAVISKESANRPCAVSRKGAQGLMQLMPATQRQFGVTDPFNPKENVNAGARLLKRLLERYTGDLALALGAYNAGTSRVDLHGAVPLIPETLHYVADVMKNLGSR